MRFLIPTALSRLYEYNEAGLIERTAPRLPDFDFEITAAELFQDI